LAPEISAWVRPTNSTGLTMSDMFLLEEGGWDTDTNT
jgi:hypothetical protein